MKKSTAVICLSPNKGGMELAALKLALILSKQLNITLIIQKNKFMHEQCLKNEDYKNLNFKTITFKSTLSFSIIFGTRKIIKDHDIKNVIFVGASELKSLYFSFLGLDINLIIRHGTTKSTPKKDWFHRLIYSDVNYHVAISKHLSKNVKKIVPLTKETKLVTIYPSMPKPISKKQKTNNDNLKLLHVGRITQGKGLKEALQACQILEQHNISFTLDSNGGMSDKYERKFKFFLNSLSYKESFNLCGFTNVIYDEYPKHDIFIFPTKGEGFGNVMMEAISHGIIILSFDNTAISNFKDMGFHIHLVEDANQEALKDELLYIAKNLEEEKEQAYKNIKKAKVIFSSEREIMEYVDLLK
ncbi:glycosyltransferase [Sulfurimonas sp.]|uniref:glycosyltransferase n=1 Tax=Sulfurimonas sp. TaxID=2022749 RepID=UPI0025ECFD08|nr:glycosyltransferase [Sulfurimonas sp.]